MVEPLPPGFNAVMEDERRHRLEAEIERLRAENKQLRNLIADGPDADELIDLRLLSR